MRYTNPINYVPVISSGTVSQSLMNFQQGLGKHEALPEAPFCLLDNELV